MFILNPLTLDKSNLMIFIVLSIKVSLKYYYNLQFDAFLLKSHFDYVK